MLEPDAVVLFQGDSITDAGRNRETANRANGPGALGQGYAMIAAAGLLATQPQARVYNRGISGNRVTNLQTRWQEDCLDLKPDVLSILIGVNDTWHGVAKGTPENGVPIDKYTEVYLEIIQQAKSANPDLILLVCEPFVTECGAVTELNFHPDIDQRLEAARDVAKQTGATLVPFQKAFKDAVAQAGDPALLAGDGVHPSLAGHGLMAEVWLQSLASAVGSV